MSLTYTQLNAIAVAAIDKTLVDNVYSATPVLKRLTGKAQKVDGGLHLQAPVISSESSLGGSYSGSETLTSSEEDNISAAKFDWKQYWKPIKISQFDIAKTSGDAAKLDLVASKIKIAESGFAEMLSDGIFSDGTGNSGKDITGFAAMIAASGTYGGIAPADMASWVATVLDNSAVDRALSLALLQQLDGALTDGSDALSLFIARQNVYDEAYNLFTAFQRIESEEMGKLGFKSLMINGKPLVVDSHAPAKTIYGINEKYVQLKIHSDHNMRKEHHKSLETSDCMLTKVFWMGNLTCSQRRRQGALTDIQVAA